MAKPLQRQLLDNSEIALNSVLPIFGKSTVQELLPTIEKFLSITDNLPDSLTLQVPMRLSPKNYAPAGHPEILTWKVLHEIKDWAYVAQCLPLFKIRQLIISYLNNIIEGSFLISALAARGIIHCLKIQRKQTGFA